LLYNTRGKGTCSLIARISAGCRNPASLMFLISEIGIFEKRLDTGKRTK